MNTLKPYWAFVVVLLTFFSIASVADVVNFTCATDPQTTSIGVNTNGSVVTARVINAGGTDFIPISATVVTPHDLPGLAATAKALEQLGAQYDLHLNVSNCTYQNGLFDCHGVTSDTINGHKVSYVAIASSKSTTTSLLYPGPMQETLFNVLITIDNTDYAFVMNYDSSGCLDTTSGAPTTPSSAPAAATALATH